MIEPASLKALAGADGPLSPAECVEKARAAAALVDVPALSRDGTGQAVLLWRNESSEAWLNTWWQPRDTGYSPPIRAIGHYDVVDGALQRTRRSPDEPSGPSEGLSAAGS